MSRSPKILVVDDNPATLYSTARILKAAGFTVIEAATGTEALAHVNDRPDLVVLDVNLPDIDGFQVCRQIRAREHTARIPVIHLSATFVKDMDKVQGLDAGADGYLTHPVEPPVLIATVNAFLRTREAEDAMRRSEARFRAIFEQALSGISLLSEQMIYLEVNPAMCSILGRSRIEILGRHLSAFTAADREDDVAQMVKPLESDGAWRGSFPVLHADGRRIELEWNISIHSDPGVRLAVVTDITQRKLIEAERERLLASERAARAEAERANRLKDDFLATLSHELRTPLNSIVGWSQLLMRQGLSPADITEGVEVIERNARAQAQLIDDLLDVSRITSGKVRLNLQSLDPARTVNAALESVMPAAAAKSIEIEKLLDANAGPITWDPSRLQQVVWNLVNNAVKFTPRGGEIQVKLGRVESLLQISVHDNGRGIRPEFLPHLFERFRQEDSSTRRGHGGLGLGLAIVKHLVEMHGGTVTAESPGEGRGSTFILRLPLVAVQATIEEQDTEQGQAHVPSRTPPAAPNLAGFRVLVVDDDADARALIRRVLGEANAEVIDASDVPQALDAIDWFRPHLLISDIGMPGEDGYDLIRQVRDRGHGSDQIGAIALTAFAREEDRERALAAGYQKHLSKPVEAQELLATTALLFGSGEQAMSIPRKQPP
jgi:hypothetical protein